MSAVPIELAALQAQLAALQERVGQLEGQLAAHRAAAEVLATATIPAAAGPGDGPAAPAVSDRLSMVVFSGSLDRVLAAFIIATAAAASGMEVVMFFTFWGLGALRDPQKRVKKSLRNRLFGMMLPQGTRGLPMSQLNLGGIGPRLIRHIMAEQGVASLEQMIDLAAELNVQIYACDMSRALLGIQMEELISYPHLNACGAATFVERAAGGKVSLFL